jgi:signal transduction histidine kinase
VHLVRRVLREAIVNAGRYAPGALVTVSVAADHEVVRLEVIDDGPVAGTHWRGGAGTGLTGLAADVAATGGTLEWGPRATGGFRVAALVPR